MSEETKGADWTSAWGILMAVFMSVVLGFGYVVSLLFSIQVLSQHSRDVTTYQDVPCDCTGASPLTCRSAALQLKLNLPCVKQLQVLRILHIAESSRADDWRSKWLRCWTDLL